MEETPFDRIGFAEELSEALVYVFTCEVVHHGLVGDCFCDCVVQLPGVWVCYAEQKIELL
jgi:hypothetical protein